MDTANRAHTADATLPVLGSVPWSLEGDYLTISPLTPLPHPVGRWTLGLRAIRLESNRRVTYREGQVVLTPGPHSEAVELLSSEAAQAVRTEAGLLLNVPSYGLIPLGADLTLAASPILMARGERSLLAAQPSSSGESQYARAIVTSTEIRCRPARASGTQRFPLDDEHAGRRIRHFGVARDHLVVTTLPPTCNASAQSLLGVAAFHSLRSFAWYPIELGANHQLLSVYVRDHLLFVRIAEILTGEERTRIDSWSLDLRTKHFVHESSYAFDARGPFSVEYAGQEAAYVYGLQINGESDRLSTLLRLDMRTGAVVAAAMGFGSQLGTPVVAVERSHSAPIVRPWLLLPVYDAIRDRTELTIREGRDLTRAPVAFVRLPPDFDLTSDGIWL